MMVRNFSNGKAVDTIETEKSRIILHELETGWWILASIALTRIPSRASSKREAKFEYSSREVAPPQLLLQQLISANSVFLLHHASSLSDMYGRLTRTKFCSLLDRFWSRFIWEWNVLLHGNPAVDIFNGTKLAAGGELGIGVGEEEWGSGEREVLEDFVARTDGLVDVVVSRFGDAPTEELEQGITARPSRRAKRDHWLGTGLDPRPSDGVLFSGVGAISKLSLATVSRWMEMIYRYGSDAYGVGENPASTQRRRKRRVARDPRTDSDSRDRAKSPIGKNSPGLRKEAMLNRAISPGIPPPLVRAVNESLETATDKAQIDENTTPASNQEGQEKASGAETMMKYLTLGYGSSWQFSSNPFQTKQEKQPKDGTKDQKENQNQKPKTESTPEPEISPLQVMEPTPEVSDDETQHFKQRLEESIGKFIIGLSGDLENEDDGESDSVNADTPEPRRIQVRTLTAEMESTVPALHPTRDPEDKFGSEPLSKHHKLQVIVYVHQPFIFTFLFALHTSSLGYPTFYRSIHHQLGPLQKPLLNSTDPTKVALRIEAAMGDNYSTTAVAAKTITSPAQSIHDLVYDPRKLTVHTSIANIPEPGTLAAEGLLPSSSGSWLTLGIPTGSSVVKAPASSSGSLSPWSRIDAINVHTQILNTYFATRQIPHELERTSKTSRGWWVLWMRIPQSSKSVDKAHNDAPREAFLVRQTSEAGGLAGGNGSGRANRKTSSSQGGWLTRDRDVSGGGGSGSAPGARINQSAVAEGIGVDARKWIEGLLALNR